MLSPFDKARYERLLEGLEIAEVNWSDLEFTNRLDAEYYRPKHLSAEKLLSLRGGIALNGIADFLIGPFGSAFAVEKFTDESIYRYIRGKDVKPMRLEENDNVYMPKSDFDRLSKYALNSGDILVSVVGTLGNSALIEESHLPAIFSCKSTAIRVRVVDPRYLLAYLNSKYGRNLLLRKERGAVQKGLNLDDLKSLIVFVGSGELQSRVACTFDASRKVGNEASSQLLKAGATLTNVLGLDTWTPPEALSYVRSSTEAFAAGRLDSQFFAPRVTELMKRLGCDGLRLRDVAPARHEHFSPGDTGQFDYIEIGGLGADGTATAETLEQSEAPSRATQYVRAGDVITSTVRPIRRLSALIAEEQDGHVCSSGFVVLEPQQISSEVLLTYLRLPLVCELMDLHTSATMYPAISEADLLSLPIPAIDAKTQHAIQQSVRDAASSREKANNLLNAAKRAVEIAIEDSEAAALAYLDALK